MKNIINKQRICSAFLNNVKYNIFRNDIFLIKILDIIDKYKISSILKAKIKDKELIDKYLKK